MNTQETDALKYPIGKFVKPDPVTADHIRSWITDIEELPTAMKALVENLDDTKLNLRYRPGSWTIRQLIHHVADSHFNSFIRFKLALTEIDPVIKPYKQEEWSLLADATKADVQDSLFILEGLHNRWVTLLKSMTPAQFERTFVHPERQGLQKLNTNLGMYAWHGKHHLAHIRLALGIK